MEVSRSRSYTPVVDDIGHVLKYECVPVSKDHPHGMTAASMLETEPVAPKPKPHIRNMMPLALDGIKVSPGKFLLGQ